jgi:O-succinylbenzoic acid--CoA ligase
MEASEVSDPSFWDEAGCRVIAPPASRLREEGREIESHLHGEEGVVFASSGSSGAAKWVHLRRDALLSSAMMVNAHLQVSRSDRWMLALPLYHVGGFGVIARAHAAGCHIRQFSGRWDARRFTETLHEDGTSLTSLVPTQVHDLVASSLDAPPSLRAVVVGGAQLDEAQGRAARALGWPVLQSYGMTEAASQVATDSLAGLERDYRCAPLPVLTGWQCRISDAGRLQLRGKALLTGYLTVEDGRIVRQDPIEEDGWFTSGDLAELEGDTLVVNGRADRQLKILGELVDVAAIERELRQDLPPGCELALVPCADARRGWRLLPFVEGSHRAGAAIDDYNARAVGYARVEPAQVLEALPRTALGKVDVPALLGHVRTHRANPAASERG